jgi:hypothetical protein
MAVSIARASLRHEAKRYVAEARLQQAQADTEFRRAQAQRLQSAAQLSRTLALGA